MSKNYDVPGQLSMFDLLAPDIWSGRTFQEPLVVEPQKVLISKRSLKRPQKLSIKLPLFLDLRTENGRQRDASWQTDGVSLGEFMTHSGGVWPSEENGFVCYATLMGNQQEKFFLNAGEKPRVPIISKLTNNLEQYPDQKYMLSPRVCRGILNRAENRGKDLPKVLKDALTMQATRFKSGEEQNLTDSENDPQVVAYGLDRASYNQGKNAKFGFSIEEEKIGAETSRGPGAVCTSVVRRLTPRECERLQGFPDDWTNIGDWYDSKGKLHKGDSDSPRYRALGNSIALPFWRWLSRRITARLKLEGYKDLSMASLFDGIGGFPLVFSECGIKPVWASEIEEFPIAVTKLRFKEEVEDEKEQKRDSEGSL